MSVDRGMGTGTFQKWQTADRRPRGEVPLASRIANRLGDLPNMGLHGRRRSRNYGNLMHFNLKIWLLMGVSMSVWLEKWYGIIQREPYHLKKWYATSAVSARWIRLHWITENI